MGLFNDLRSRGIYTGYERYVQQMEPILQGMTERGIPVSPQRHAALTVELEHKRVEVWKAMQAFVPDAVRAHHPKKGYKKVPKDVVEGASTTHADEPAIWSRRWFNIHTGAMLQGDIESYTYEQRWVKLLEWTPSSGVNGGLLRYALFKKHPIPTNWKSGKITFEQRELERLANKTKDPVYDAILEYRDIGTMLDNHLKNWKPGPDGRVHPTFYQDTGTGQLGARRPNSMNAPKHKASQGDAFRSLIQATPGHTLLELDYKAFHVQTLAFAAQDPDLLRLAKLDVHSFVTAHFLKLPDASRCLAWDDDTLREYLARIKRDHKALRDAKVKHAFLGYDNGMGYRKLYNHYMEFFSGQAEAKRLMDLLDGLFPRAKAYRERIVRQAHEQGYLISRFGCIRWFWEVFKWDGSGWSHGEEHEAALCFEPQNTAHCHLKEAMLRIELRGYASKWRLINPMHDALLFEVPTPALDWAMCSVAGEMERPSEVLVDPIVAPTGLSVAVTASYGQQWNRMEEVEWQRVAGSMGGDPYPAPSILGV